MNGYGRHVYEDNATYEGEYVDGERDGYGVYTWPDGVTYRGLWLCGK